MRRFADYLHQRFTTATDLVPDETIQPVGELYGANGSFPMAVLRAVGGWDASMHGIEDTELSRRIRAAYPEHRFYAVPTARIIHAPEMTFGQFLCRQVRRGPVTLTFYRANGLTPPVFPYPLIFLAALILTFITMPYAAPAAIVVMPQLLYIWWAVRAWRERDPLFLAFAYIQLAEEASVIIGLIRGYGLILATALRRSKTTRRARAVHATVFGNHSQDGGLDLDINANPALARRYRHLTSSLSRRYSDFRVGTSRSERFAWHTDDTVLLTFDDYGTEAQVDRLLGILAREHVHAMFFVTGEWADAEPQLIRRIAAGGHALGRHSYTHPNLSTLDGEELTRQITYPQAFDTVWFRAPMGRANAKVRRLIASADLKLAYWSLDSDDWQGVSPAYIHEKVMRNLHPGAVILFHIHADNAAEALPGLIRAARARGYRFATQPHTPEAVR